MQAVIQISIGEFKGTVDFWRCSLEEILIQQAHLWFFVVLIVGITQWKL